MNTILSLVQCYVSVHVWWVFVSFPRWAWQVAKFPACKISYFPARPDPAHWYRPNYSQICIYKKRYKLLEINGLCKTKFNHFIRLFVNNLYLNWSISFVEISQNGFSMLEFFSWHVWNSISNSIVVCSSLAILFVNPKSYTFIMCNNFFIENWPIIFYYIILKIVII